MLELYIHVLIEEEYNTQSIIFDITRGNMRILRLRLSDMKRLAVSEITELRRLAVSDAAKLGIGVDLR